MPRAKFLMGRGTSKFWITLQVQHPVNPLDRNILQLNLVEFFMAATSRGQ
jgi:hypothetical protein